MREERGERKLEHALRSRVKVFNDSELISVLLVVASVLLLVLLVVLMCCLHSLVRLLSRGRSLHFDYFNIKQETQKPEERGRENLCE